MASTLDERLAFNATWQDPQAQLDKQYQLFFYPADNSIEMYDVKQHRTFLKRSKYPQLRLEELFEGASVNIFSRQLVIRGFGDDFTRKRMTRDIQKTVCLITSSAYKNTGKIIDELVTIHQFSLCRLKMVDFGRYEAEDFLTPDYLAQPGYEEFVKVLSTGPVTALELTRPDAVEFLKHLAGPEYVPDAKRDQTDSLRARYGDQNYSNGLFISQSSPSAYRESEFIFGAGSQTRFARPDDENILDQDCSLALVKPHAFVSGLTGKVIDAILKGGYYITDMELFHLDKPSADEFLEVYKGVVHEFHAMVDELISGPVVAMKITRPPSSSVDSSVVPSFREFVGPWEPEIAKKIRPSSLRAKFGQDKVRNAVHCTDLPNDGVLEVQYFFRILSS